MEKNNNRFGGCCTLILAYVCGISREQLKSRDDEEIASIRMLLVLSIRLSFVLLVVCRFPSMGVPWISFASIPVEAHKREIKGGVDGGWCGRKLSAQK